jgi:hypothetical protein
LLPSYCQNEVPYIDAIVYDLSFMYRVSAEAFELAKKLEQGSHARAWRGISVFAESGA